MEISVIEQFKQWLIEDGRADSTVQSYVNDVSKFNSYLVERDIDLEVLLSRFYFTSYLKQLQKDEMKVNTINKKITSLKVYNEWLRMNGMIDDVYIRIKKDKIRIANGSEDEVSVLTDEQVERFLFYLEKESERNKCIGYLLLYTGVRVTELVDIKMDDIDRLTAQLNVRGKGGKYRQIPLRKDVLQVIKKYLECERKENRNGVESSFLLISQRAPKMHSGKVFWDTLKTRNGWKIQQNSFTKHYRILDPNNVRHGWASEYNEIEELFEIYSGERFK